MNGPLSTATSRLSARITPAGTFTFAPTSTRFTSNTVTCREAIRSGSSSTRICRFRPPTTSVRAVSGTPCRATSTCSPTRRKVKSSAVLLHRVTFTNGTSSISTGLTTHPVTPGGTWSVLMAILLCSLTRLFSRCSPT